MSLLLSLERALWEPDLGNLPGLAGLVVPVSSSDLQTSQFSTALLEAKAHNLALFFRLTDDTLATHSVRSAWSLLEKLQSQFHFAHLVLPYGELSLGLVRKSMQYHWRWHLEGAKTITQVERVLTAGAGGIWLQIGRLDGFHEQDGDELCSQTRSVIDEAATTQHKALLVATDIRDQDHVERTILYGCDYVVLKEPLWSNL